MAVPYTLEDLANAKHRVKICQDRIANHSANNPDFGRADLRAAIREVEAIRDDLKARGEIPLTEQEQLEAKLDASFPDARSKEIVEFEGKRYQRRFSPKHMSRSRKTVMEWNRWWEQLND